MPIGTAHPHFPCLWVNENNTQNIMQYVEKGLQDTCDEIVWRPQQYDSEYTISVTVFLGSQRIVLTVQLFRDEKRDVFLLQPVCESGYGWDFYTVWEGIRMELKASGKRVQQHIPNDEPTPQKDSRNQPSLADQVRIANIPVSYSTSASTSGAESGNANPNSTFTSTNATDDSFTTTTGYGDPERVILNLLRSSFENERCMGLELLEGSNEMSHATKLALLECIGSDNSYSGSRIRALSLVIHLVKQKIITDDFVNSLVIYLKQGLSNLYKDDESHTPAFRDMMREYAQLGLNALANVDYGTSIDEDLMFDLEKAKTQCYIMRSSVQGEIVP